MVTILPALRQVGEDLAGLLERREVERICRELEYTWRERQLDPYTTLHLFILQVVNQNTAMTHLPHLSGGRRNGGRRNGGRNPNFDWSGSGDWRRCDPTPDPGDEVTAERRLYDYDPIGNRTDSTEGTGGTTYYCANALNQYKFTDDASGTCPTPSTPTESFTYDADGNLASDGSYLYAWDAENRLIGVEPFAFPSQGDKRLAFEYDYMSRRIRKQVFTFNASIEEWELAEDLRIVYDRWNLILVLDGTDSNAVLRKYTWGFDLSGLRGDPTPSGIHGAGGIGGLLAVEETGGAYAGSYWFLHDANGNVTQLVENTTNYPLAVHYEYDAYGNVLGTPTAYAAANPFRFSTKWYDWESGLGYYGYRYKGERWLSRDTIGELGGFNLYQYAVNSPYNAVDPLGQSPATNCRFMCGQCCNNCRASGNSQRYCEAKWNTCHASCAATGSPSPGCTGSGGGGGGGSGGGGGGGGGCQVSCLIAGGIAVSGIKCAAVSAGAATPPGAVVVATAACCVAGAVITYKIIKSAS